MLKKSYKLIRPCSPFYLGAVAATFFSVALTLLNPLIISFVIDYALTDAPVYGITEIITRRLGGINHIRANIWLCSLTIITTGLLSGIFTFLRSYLSAASAENIAKSIKDKLYSHLQNLPFDYHVKAQTGDLIQRCTADVETVRNFFSANIIDIFRILFLSSISIVVLLRLNTGLALATLAFVPFIFLYSLYFFGRIKKSFRKADIKDGELSAVLQENLTGVRVVRAFAMESYELKKYQEKNGEYRDLVYKNLMEIAAYWGTSDLLCFAQISTVMLFGSYLAYKGRITLGTFMVFLVYVNNLIWPVRQLGRILNNMGKMEVSLDRIMEILNVPEEHDTPGAAEADLKGDIIASNLSFRYSKETPVLSELNFTVKKGERIGILGAAGSGKSTLMHLFLRLYDYEGSITINGHELKNVEKKYLRSKVGIVLQEPFLYSKTIADNIKMSKENLSDEEMYNACNTAHVLHVVEGFKEGFDTMVGERGVTLSGGQRQRIAIARTLVKNSHILIFDDSLSAVDSQTDSIIRKSLERECAGVTTFIISQRITTLMGADRIFVMEGGRIVSSGTHEELINKEGLYKRIWDIQNMVEDDFLEEEASLE